MYVYADVLVLFNFIINSIILLLTAWIAGVSCRWWRLSLGAFIGSIYSLLEVFPALQLLYSPAVKLMVSVLIILVAFGRHRAAKTLLLVAAFYLVSFLLGGAVVGWLFFGQDSLSVLFSAKPMLKPAWSDIAAGIMVGAAMLFFLFKRLIFRAEQRQSLYPCLLEYAGRQVKIVGLLDTGNSLASTLGSRPVILVDYTVITTILSPAAAEFLQSHRSENWLEELADCRDENWLTRIELIPYRGVGTASILLGFRPDNLILYTPTGIIETSNVLVAIYHGTLSPSGRYTALLNSAIFRHNQFNKEASVCA